MEKAIFMNGHIILPSSPCNPDSDNMLAVTSSRNAAVARPAWLLCSAIKFKVPDMASILPSLVVLSAP